MIDTGLEVTVDATKAKQGAAEFEAAMDKMATKAETAFAKIQNASKSALSHISGFQLAIAGFGMEQFIKSLVDTQLMFNRINITLEAATGSTRSASVAYNFLMNTVQKLGLDLSVAGVQFATLEAAARGTALQGEKSREVFYGFATAISALHLPAERAELILGALQRMVSTNVVNMRELRLQLAMSLPGAFKIAADAMGVTQSKLSDMVRQGKVLASDLLPKMAEILQGRYAAAADQAANSTQGLINKLKTNWLLFLNDINNAGFSDSINNLFRALNNFLTNGSAKQLAEDIGTALSFAVEHVKALAIGFGVLTAAKTLLWFAELYSDIKKVTTALLAMEAVQALMGKTKVAGAAIIGAENILSEEAALSKYATSLSKVPEALKIYAARAKATADGIKVLEAGEVAATVSSTGLRGALGTVTAAGGGAVQSLLAASAAVPVWGEILIAITAVLGALYLVKDQMIRVGDETMHADSLYKGWANRFEDAARTTKKEFLDDVNAMDNALRDFLGTERVDRWEAAFNSALDSIASAFDNLSKKMSDALTPKSVKDFATKAENFKYHPENIDDEAEALLRTQYYGATKSRAPQGLQEMVDNLLNGQIKPDKPDAGAFKANRYGDEVSKLRDEIAALAQDTDANLQYQHSLEGGVIALAKIKAAREAETEIIRLNNALKGKMTLAQKQEIRDLFETKEVMAATFAASSKNLRDRSIELDYQIPQQDRMNAAVLQGEAATNREQIAIEAENAVRAIGIGLLNKDYEAYKKRVEQFKEAQQLQQYEKEAESLKASINPLYARAQAEEHLFLLEKTGVLTTRELAQARRDLDRAYDESVNTQLEKSQRWQDGIILAMRRVQMASQDTAKNVADTFSDMFTQMEDAMTNFLDSGKFDWKSLDKSLLHSVNSLLVKNTFGDIFGKLLGQQGTGDPDTGRMGGGWLAKLLGVAGVFKDSSRPLGQSGNPMHVVVDGHGGLISAGQNPLDPQGVVGQLIDMQTNQVEQTGQVWDEAGAKVANSWEQQGSGLFSVLRSMLAGGQSGGSGSPPGGLFDMLFGQTKGDGGGLLGGLFGAGGSGGSDPASNVDFGGGFDAPVFANGGIMTSRGVMRLNRYSLGGIARTPQLAMFGEGSGPEAFVPLPDGRNIPVTMQGKGNGGTVIINQTFNINGVKDVDSFRRSQSQILHAMAMGTQIAQERNG